MTRPPAKQLPRSADERAFELPDPAGHGFQDPQGQAPVRSERRTQAGAGKGQELRGGLGDDTGGAGSAIQQGQLPEEVAGAQTGDGAALANNLHRSVEDQIEDRPRGTFLDESGSLRTPDDAADPCHVAELASGEACEQGRTDQCAFPLADPGPR